MGDSRVGTPLGDRRCKLACENYRAGVFAAWVSGCQMHAPEALRDVGTRLREAAKQDQWRARSIG